MIAFVETNDFILNFLNLILANKTSISRKKKKEMPLMR